MRNCNYPFICCKVACLLFKHPPISYTFVSLLTLTDLIAVGLLAGNWKTQLNHFLLFGAQRRMAKSSADDEELRRACAMAIEGTKQEIAMSIRVAKSRGIWGKSGKLGRGHMAKPRVLAISSTAIQSFSRYLSIVSLYVLWGRLEMISFVYFAILSVSKLRLVT